MHMSIENFKKQTSGNMIQRTFTFSQVFPCIQRQSFFLKLNFSIDIDFKVPYVLCNLQIILPYMK